MKDVRDAIANILDKTSLADMLEREEKAEQQERGIFQYFI
jgi:DNA-binding IscR family transcriptional regulator